MVSALKNLSMGWLFLYSFGNRDQWGTSQEGPELRAALRPHSLPRCWLFDPHLTDDTFGSLYLRSFLEKKCRLLSEGCQRVDLSVQCTDAVGGGRGTPAVSDTCGDGVKPQLWPHEGRGQVPQPSVRLRGEGHSATTLSKRNP